MRRYVPIVLLLAACGGGAPPDDTASETSDTAPSIGEATPMETPVTDPRDIPFASSLQVDLAAMEKQESGLYVQVLQEGEGTPAVAGDQMGVHYTVWLSDGSKLDSSFDHAPPDPLPMVLNETALIDGWTEGVTGMRLGEKRRLVVPYDLAYGAAGRPPQVPPYTALVFEVELAQHSPGGGG